MRDPEQHYTALLGEEFGRVYNAVSSEWCQALVRLEEIKTLLGSQEKCDTLNRLAPPFFADVQELFWNDLMLRVARLTDRSRNSLRVRSLERFLEKDSALLKEVKGHREAAANAAAPITVRRNQVIAHYQRSRALQRTPQPLPSVTLNACKEVLDHVHAALHAIEYHYAKSHLSNEIVHNPASGDLLACAEELVGTLELLLSLIDWDGDPASLESTARTFMGKLGRFDQEGIWQIHELLVATATSPHS